MYYERIDVSEEIDINKTSASKEYDIFHYWYFLDKGFKFQQCACNGCNDVLMMCINSINVAVFLKGSAKVMPWIYLKNVDLTKKREHYKSIELWKNLLSYIKWVTKLYRLAMWKLKNTNVSNKE